MKKWLRAVALMVSLYGVSAWAEGLDFPHIETSGVGEVTVKPDMAEFSVRVEESTLTAEDAKSRVDKAVADFIERLTSTGVKREDITASNIQLAPKYHYPKSGKTELVGYHASRRILVTVYELEKLNAYLDGAIGDGINRIDNIQLKVKNQKHYQEQARMAAIQDAKEKAHSLAKGFEVSLGGVWRISYDNSYVQPVLYAAKAMDSRMASESAGYDDASLVIKDQVSVVFKLAE